MKKQLSILMLLAALLVPWASSAQISVAIGDTTSTATQYTLPINNYFHYSLSEQIIDADEMEGPMLIQSISFKYAHTVAMSKATDVRIYLQHTEKTEFGSTTDYEAISDDAVLVYSGNLNCSTGWNTFVFTTPFEYDGASNLMVIVHDNANLYDGTAFKFSTSATTPYKAFAFYSYTYNPYASGTFNTSASKSRYQYRSVMKLNGTPSTTTICRKPTNLIAHDITPNEATIEWTAGENETSWIVSVNGGDEALVNSEILGLDTLQANTLYTVSVRAYCAEGDTSRATTITFRTTCDSYATDDLPYLFDPDSLSTTTTATDILCFGHIGGGYVNIATRTGFTGNTVRFYPNSSSQPNILILPTFEENISNLYMTFKTAPEGVNSGSISVGYITDPMDSTTFVALNTYPVSLFNTTGSIVPARFDALFTDAPAGARIAFRHNVNSTSYYWFIDEVRVMELPTCPRPSSVTFSEITSNSASMVINSDNSHFMMLFAQYPSTVYDTIEIDGNGYDFTGLAMGAQYVGTIYSICDDDTSTFGLAYNFTTDCSALAEGDLPYTEGFEAYGTGGGNPISPCWTKRLVGSGTTTAFPYPYSTAAITGNRGLYFYSVKSSSSDYASWVALPPIDEDLDVSMLQVNFKVKRDTSVNSTSSTKYGCMLLVGVADSVTGLTTMAALDTAVVWIDTLDYSSGEASQIYPAEEVSFENYEGTGKYIVFYAPRESVATSNYNTVYLDDITLRTIPSCFWPISASVDTMTTEMITVSWVPDPRTENPDSWSVEYGLKGFTPGEGETTTVNDTTAVELTDLLVNTAYDIYIAANCGGDMSEAIKITAQTNSIPAELPYHTGFEAEQDSGWVIVNADQVNYWKIGTYGDTNANRALYITDNDTVANYVNTTSNVFAFRLFEVADTGDYYLSFDWRCQGESTYDYLRAFIVPNSVAITPGTTNGITSSTTTPSGWMNVGNYNNSVKLNLSSAWQTNELIYHVSPSELGLYKLVLFWHNDNSTANMPPAIIDNVHLYKITCPAPINLVADSITPYEIYYSWDEFGTEASWEVKLDTGDWIPVATNSYVATGLTQVTPYTFQVRAICDEGDTSFASQSLTVFTKRDCGEDNTNIVDTIGNGTSTTNYVFYNSTSYPTGVMSSIYRVQELNDMGLMVNNRINGIKLHSGSLSGTIRQAKVYVKEVPMESYGSTVANDTVDRNTMTLVYSGDITVQANSWVNIPFDSAFAYSGNNNLLITFARDTLSTAAITFYYTSTSPDYLSFYGYRSSATQVNSYAYRTNYRPNVVFDICTEIPACERPASLAVTAYDETSFTLTWNGSSDAYEVAVYTELVDPDTATAVATYTVNDETVAVTGLTQNTTYYYFVRSICGVVGNSDWSIPGNVTTACSPMSLPYTEDFENYGTGAAQPISPCWTKGTSNTTAYPYPYGTSAVNGQRSLYFYSNHPSSGTGNYCYAALPMFQDSVKNLSLSFSVRRYNSTTTTYTTYLVMGVMTNPNDITTFEPMDTLDLYTATPNSINSYEYYFSNYTGNGKYIAIYAPVPPLYGTNTSCTNYAYVDDVMVDYIPSCPRPKNMTVTNITSNSATVHWTSAADLFEIEFGPQGFAHGMGTMTSVSDDSIAFTGLTPGTGYDVYVRAHCTATDTSIWSFAANFITDCGPIPIPFSENFDVTLANHPCWRGASNATAAQVFAGTALTLTAPTSWTYTGTRCGLEGGHYYRNVYGTSVKAWMITPEIDLSQAASAVLSFDVALTDYNNATLPDPNGDTNRTQAFMVIVSTDGGNTWLESNATKWQNITGDYTYASLASTSYLNQEIDLTAYLGDTIKIAFYCQSLVTGGDNDLHLDNIHIGPASPCPRATNLTASNATQNSVVLSWNDTIGSTQWRLAYALDTSNTWTEITVTSNPDTLTGLTPNTIYKYKVAPICADGQQADWSHSICRFNTAQIPAAVPYNYDLEDAAEWQNWQTFSNNNAKWYRGVVANGETTNTMYLSSDNGATNSWIRANVTNSAAYRDIDFGPVPHSFAVTFRYHGGGNTSAANDGVAVLLEEPATIPVASNTYLESPWGHVGYYHARLDTSWGTRTVLFDSVSGVRRLVFFHFNNALSGTTNLLNIAPSIDDIAVVQQVCERPNNVTVDNINSTYVTVHWNGDSTGDYVVHYRVTGTTGTSVYDTVAGLSTVIHGLTSNTGYDVRVKRMCNDSTFSYWTSYTTFTTDLCPNATVATIGDENSTTTNYTLPVNNNWKFNLTETIIDSAELVGMTEISAIGYYYAYATDMTAKTNVAIWIQPTDMIEFAGTAATNAEALKPTAVKVYEGSLNCTQGWNYFTFDTIYHYSGSGNLMIIVDDNSGAYNSSTYIFKTSSTSLYKSFSFYSDSYNTDVNSITSSTASKARYTYRPVMKLVDCGTAPVCNAPDSISVDSITYNSAIITWTNVADSFEVAYTLGEWNESISGTTMVGNAINLTGLLHDTTYIFGVRTICEEDMVSDWLLVYVQTDNLPCYVPTNVAVSNVGYNTATVSFTPGMEQTQWEVHVFGGANINRTETVTTTTVNIDNLVINETYQVAVRALCSGNRTSDWSDTVSFTTLNCTAPTNVNVDQITATTAHVTWTGSASSYKVEYGYAGSGQGAAIASIPTTGNSINLTGLEPETMYDVYVISVCAEGIESVWSLKQTFTTLEQTGNYYTITVLSNNEDWGTVDGGNTYPEGYVATITATPKNGYRFVEWQEDHNTNSVRNITVTGDATYTAIFAEGVGIDEAEMNEVSLFPNPASSMVTIRANGMEQVTVIDLNGSTVMTQRVNNETFTFDVSNLAKGAYFVRIIGGEGTAVRKLIVK